MSFDNLASRSSGTPDDRFAERRMNSSNNEDQYDRLRNSVNIQIFKINSNVQGISRLAERIGTSQDNVALHTSLANLTESTRNMIEKSRADIQNLAAMNLKPGVSTINKEMEQRIAKELFTAISSFQKAQRLFAEKQKRRMEHEQRKLNEMLDDAEPWASNATSSPAAEPTRMQSQEQSHVTHTGVDPATIAFQESIISDREQDIREIESGIQELSEVFHDLNKIIGEQGEMIDNIESNVVSVSDNTRFAGEELTTAHEYQRKAGRRMICLLLILLFVVAVVLIAILL